MADAITIRIDGDASGATTAIKGTAAAADQLGTSLTFAGTSGELAGNEIAEGMQKAEFSTMEARHAAMMLGEETGIRIPRALAGIAARSETLGPILAGAFSGIALIAFAELIVKGTEKLTDWIAKTFLFTDAMKAVDNINKSINADIVDQNSKLKELNQAYELIGLTGSKLTGKKFEFFNADQMAPAEALLKEMSEDMVGFGKSGQTAAHNIELVNGLIQQANKSMPKDAQMPMLPSSASMETALDTLRNLQATYQKNVQVLEQQGANQQKTYENEVVTEAAAALQKREAAERNFAKLQEEVAKARVAAIAPITAAFDEMEKVQVSRGETELATELKIGEATQKAADAELKLNVATAKAAAEAQSDAVARDKAQGLTHQQVADTQKLVTLLQQQKDAELAVVDAKMQEAQAAMDMAETSGAGGGLNVADYNNALASYREYQAQRVTIAAEADKKIASANDTDLKAEQKEYQQYLSSFNSAFASAFAQVASGHETLGKAAMKIYDQMAMSFLKNMALTMMAEVEGALLHKTLAQQKQLTDAKGAAGGAWNATAGIPIIGPVLAPIAAAAAFAGVMAFDDGGMVPSTQMSLVHAREAVLNPRQTENFRQMTEQGAGGAVTHNYGDTHIHANDAKSFENYLKRNPAALSAGITHAVANGHLSPTALTKGK
jgi:hypothetical protein